MVRLFCQPKVREIDPLKWEHWSDYPGRFSIFDDEDGESSDCGAGKMKANAIFHKRMGIGKIYAPLPLTHSHRIRGLLRETDVARMWWKVYRSKLHSPPTWCAEMKLSTTTWLKLELLHNKLLWTSNEPDKFNPLVPLDKVILPF